MKQVHNTVDSDLVTYSQPARHRHRQTTSGPGGSNAGALRPERQRMAGAVCRSVFGMKSRSC